jgi:hypothetical protein
MRSSGSVRRKVGLLAGLGRKHVGQPAAVAALGAEPRLLSGEPAPAASNASAAKRPRPSSLAQTGPEEWQQTSFWHVKSPGRLAPLLSAPSGAWRHTTDNVRIQLDAVLPEVTETTNIAERVRLAKAVRTACELAFASRSYTALRKSIASLSAMWTAIIVGASLAVVACLRWGLSLVDVFALLGGQAVFLLALRVFERGVFPGVLRWGFGSERWSHIARLYGRTIVFLVVGLGSMVAVLTLADRNHHLTWLEHIGLVAPLGCLAVVVGLWTAIGVQALGQLVRAPQDPYPEVITSLVEACYLLLQHRASARVKEELVLRGPDRLAVASALERPSRALQVDSGMCARVDGALCSEVAGGLRQEGAKVSAWLRLRQHDVLIPKPDAGAEVLTTLKDGFVAACEARWKDLQAEPLAAITTQPNWLARMGPRIGVAIALLGAAFAIPAVLGKTLSPGAGTTLTVTLVITALTALAAPSTAVSSVASDIAGLVKRP